MAAQVSSDAMANMDIDTRPIKERAGLPEIPEGCTGPLEIQPVVNPTTEKPAAHAMGNPDNQAVTDDATIAPQNMRSGGNDGKC
jgi:hypothetical protein